MTRINAIRNIATRKSVTWGKGFTTKYAGALVFAAVLIVCSLTVGCSSNNDQPKPVSSNNQIPITQSANPISSIPTGPLLAGTKPAPKPTKKVVHKKPATVNYTDQTYGLAFEYPRRYAIETGNAATGLLAENPIAMNFVQPGGVALAAVELPETSFANTDFSSAFFNVSVNKSLTADQCTEFAVPQPKMMAQPEPAPTSTPVADASAESRKDGPTEIEKSDPAASAQSSPSVDSKNVVSKVVDQKVSDQKAAQKSESNPTTDVASNSKLMLGDLALDATEAVAGEGTRQSDSKYFHVFQNGACYEFALNVTTIASDQGITKHVDRDKVFNRLEQILSTVKINPVAAPEVTAETPTPTSTPAQ